MKTTHILKTTSGPIVTATFDETTGEFVCAWEPYPLTKEQIEALLPEYGPWRNRIFDEWGRRTGQRVMVVTV